MAGELGKIEKPAAELFKKGRRLFFVPLLYGIEGFPPDYLEKLERYWAQVEEQIRDLELKLGKVSRLYHEAIQSGGEDGLKALKILNEQSCKIAGKMVEKGAILEGAEDADLLSEYIDWSRCLSAGLQNPKVVTKVYESYEQTGKSRNEFITRQIDKTLQPDEIGIIFMREGQHIKFPAEVEVFYIAPPTLDEINRWLRDRKTEAVQDTPEKDEK